MITQTYSASPELQGQTLANFASDFEYLSRAGAPSEPSRNWVFGAISQRVETLQTLLADDPEDRAIRDLLDKYQNLEARAWAAAQQPPYSSASDAPKMVQPSKRRSLVWKAIQKAAFLHLIIIVLASCGIGTPPAPTIPPYDFDYPLLLDKPQEAGCFPGVAEESLAGLGDWEEKMLAKFAGELTPHQLERQSLKFHSEVLSDFEVVNNDDAEMLEDILEQLVAVVDRHGIEHPDFKVFLVHLKVGLPVINAWTTGSYIYFSQDILGFCDNDPPQLAAIMGHEISHTLHEHTSHFAQRDQLAVEWFGEKWGKKVVTWYKGLVASPLGQANELQSDLTALILMYEAGFDPADSLKPYKHMADERDRDKSTLRILKSHPISEQRLACLAAAIERARINGKKSTDKSFSSNH